MSSSRRIAVLLTASSLVFGAPAFAGCPSPRIDETSTLTRVLDGDTIIVADARKIRLIGVNAPEIGRDHAPSDPLAEEARAHLVGLLRSAPRVKLQYGRERRDRHGRILAHVFARDTNVQRSLIDAGLAFSISIPPNTWSGECYRATERRARHARRGVWSLSRYQPLPVETIAPSLRGFRLITGTVRNTGHSRNHVWLDLSPTFSLHIPIEALGHFIDLDPAALLGRRVEARGWITRRRNRQRIVAYDPHAIKTLPQFPSGQGSGDRVSPR